jgi:putative DNA methylase
LAGAEKGTIQNGQLVHSVNGETFNTSVKAIRGDAREKGGASTNLLRRWEKTDIVPRPDDIL